MIAWTGVLLRDQELGERPAFRAYFGPSKSDAQRARDLRDLEDATLLDPSSEWDMARATYLLKTGDRRRAAAIAGAVTRDEPRNLVAWSVLVQATRSPTAAATIKRLNPLGSR